MIFLSATKTRTMSLKDKMQNSRSLGEPASMSMALRVGLMDRNESIVLQAALPFAVVGSNGVTEVHGQRVRARIYPWGIVEGNHTQ